MLQLQTDMPRVSVFLTNAYTTHGDMLRGILDYTSSHRPWALDLKAGRRDESHLSKFNWSSCDAVIVYGVTPKLFQHIRRARLPVILVSPDPVPDFPGCVLYCDNKPIAETAARHLLSKQCAAYAFVDVPGMTWADLRGRFFADALSAVGATCLRLHADNQKSFARQLTAAPKPLGVFAADDLRARKTLDACCALGCAVPDDVAILGVDNDETLCEFSNPTLSSIPLSARTAGYRAAEILDRALRGELSPDDLPNAVYTGDTVVERQSTARSFARDALVRRCRDLLAANFTSPLHVPDLARTLHVSRRTLETRFRQVTGTSVNEEIIRLRLERAKHLLATTKQPHEKIALSCGFCDASHLGAVFRKRIGRPPSAFRHGDLGVRSALSAFVLLFGSTAFGLTNVETVTRISDMQRIWESTAPKVSHPFSLTGTVYSVYREPFDPKVRRPFIVDDGRQRIQLFNRLQPPLQLKEGQRIAVSGIFGLQKQAYGNEPYAVAYQAQALGSGAPVLPTERRLQDLSLLTDDLRLIRTTGTVIDYQLDETDSNYLNLTLKDGPTSMLLSILCTNSQPVEALVDARVSVVGIFCRTISGQRRYSNSNISTGLPDIRMLTPPPSSIPPLEHKIYLTPQEVRTLGKRRVSGEVIAVWQQRNLMIREDDGRIVRIKLSRRNTLPPHTGARVTAFGHPETDQFNVILGTATLAPCASGTNVVRCANRLMSPSSIVTRQSDTVVYAPTFHGQLITLGGTIRSLPSPGNAEGRLILDSDGYLVPLDASSCPSVADGLELGCEVEATGVCLIETNEYDAQTDTPHISGLTLVLRGRDDIVVLARPPWLTPFRFFVILLGMARFLVAVLIWNASLRVLVEVRGRELLRKQSEVMKARFRTAERTRLATDLHDSVVQNLTGAALEIRAAKAVLPTAETDLDRHLDIALKTINSSRAELRHCIWDLRNQALEQHDTDEAIRITLQPHLGATRLVVRFSVPRRRIPDNELHGILCIIRELVLNAVRHGHAKTVRVAGALDGGRILFSVSDDGCGFDPATRPGMEQGHFGIEGVTERAKALDGTVAVDSAPGRGTRITVNVALQEDS